MESVPTEEEAAEYLEHLAFEEEKEQILLVFFSREEDIGYWFVFVNYKAFTTRIERIYDRMCLLSVYFKTNRFASAHKIVSVYRS